MARKSTRQIRSDDSGFDLITDGNGKKKLKIDASFDSRKTSASINTALSHVENLIRGVTKGFRYKDE
ncbi:60S ribosomal protein L9-like, partial [Trifolium medium]|nr:60S ribosomal protein L9-like [Trifolium medium]